jgi:hypothetical protein
MALAGGIVSLLRVKKGHPSGLEIRQLIHLF